MPIRDVERYPLTFGPSPVHPFERLSAHLRGAQVWAKSEDVSSGLAFGGNKTRKLEAGLATSTRIPVGSTVGAIRLSGRLEGMTIDPV
jgi:1-aminocyclopropane-1-carboxylate deaminase/D-cysteine desulfhydrase-like pyridoxal-dependent ACC family enzyme